MSHSNSSIVVNPTGIKYLRINIKSQMNDFLRQLKKNCHILQQEFGDDIFTEIKFHYREISYAEYIKPSSKFNKKSIT